MKNDRTENLLREAADALNTEPEQLITVINKFKKEAEELEREVASLGKQFK